MCTCGREPETTLLYLLRCNLYSTQRLEPLNNVCIPNPSQEYYSNEKLLNILYMDQKILIVLWTRKYWKLQSNFWKYLNVFMTPFLSILKTFCHNGTYFLVFLKKFRYMYRTCFKRHVTFSMFCVLFSLVLAFFISCNL